MTDGQHDIADLSQRLRDGDQSALRECFDRWGRLIHTLAVRATGGGGDADDITQRTFIAAWESRGSLRVSDSTLPAWLVGIAKHKIVDHHRGVARRARSSDEAGRLGHLAAPVVDDGVAALADRLLIADALAELGEPKASIVRALFLHGLSHQQVAEQMSLPLGTIKSHARRGLARLRLILEEVDREDA